MMSNINDQRYEMKRMDQDVDFYDELMDRNDGPRPRIGFNTINRDVLRDALDGRFPESNTDESEPVIEPEPESEEEPESDGEFEWDYKTTLLQVCGAFPRFASGEDWLRIKNGELSFEKST